MAKLGLIAPSVFRVDGSGEVYGFEACLSWLADGLAQHFDVTLIAPKGSGCEKAKVFETIDPPSQWGDEEQRAYEVYKSQLESFDIVLDASHKKLAYQSPTLRLMGSLNGVQTLAVSRASPCLITLSDWHKKQHESAFKQKSRVIPYGIDVSRYKEGSHDGGFALMFGAKLPHKGDLDLVNAWPADSKVQLVVAGQDNFGCPPDYVKKLKTACKEKAITYMGGVDGKTKIDLMSRASSVLLPMTRPEAFSVLALESMAVGTPVITTDHLDGVPHTVASTTVLGIIRHATGEHEFRDKCTPPREFVQEHFPLQMTIDLYRAAIEDVTSGKFW